MASSRCYRALYRFSNLNLNLRPSFNITKQATRSIFSREILGLDSYHRFASGQYDRLKGIKDKFMPRMEEYLNNEQNVIFVEDLKNMLVLAETDEDLSLTEKMIKRYYTKSGETALRQFSFGPVIMRMLYCKNKQDVALKLYNDPELTGLFSHLTSVILLVDMLYEDKQYKNALGVCEDHITYRLADNVFRVVFPMDLITIVFAIYYKMNTPEALVDAKNFVNKLHENRAVLTFRAVSFLCMLCLNQNDAVYGYEVLCAIRRQDLHTVRNLKVQCLTHVGRLEEAVLHLSWILNRRSVQQSIQGHEIFPETVNKLEEAVTASDDDSLKQQFLSTKEGLESGGHISAKSLAEFIEEQIRRPRGMRGKSQNYNDGSDDFDQFDDTSRTPRDNRGFVQQSWRRPAFGGDFGDDRRRARGFMGDMDRRGVDDDMDYGRDYGRRNAPTNRGFRDDRFQFRRNAMQDGRQ